MCDRFFIHNSVYIKLILQCFIFFLILTSCSKTIIDINVDDKGDSLVDDSVNKNKKTKIDFKAAVISQLDKSRNINSEPISTERLITVYAYTAVQDSILFATVNYKTEVIGTMSPIVHPLSLITGIYNLYAVGINAPNSVVPTFTDGKAVSLQNGVDYIWDGIYNLVPIGIQDSLSILFNHCSTQILIDLVVQSGITVNSVSSVSISPPDLLGVEWDLFNSGKIVPATSINTHPNNMVNMGFKKTDFGFLASYILVPICVDKLTNIVCNFSLRIDNENKNRDYKLNLPIYKNELKAGYAYKYHLTLERDTVLFTDVNIVDWHVIDVNGNPIIPIKVD